MAAIITEKFRIHNARQFKEDFGEAASSTFLFIGRPQQWDASDTTPTPSNSIGEMVNAYTDMIAMKKITSSDVSHALVRRDWTTGTTYDEYAHDYSATNTSPASSANNLYDSRYFVITDDYNVYKCLRTGRDSSGNVVASTVKPTGTSTNPFAVADSSAAAGRGYIWKYMYSVSASETIKFVTNDFIPVKTLGAQTEVNGDLGAFGSAGTDDGSTQYDVETAAVDGGIHHVVVSNGGAGYTNGTYNNVAVTGDGSGAVVSVVVAGGAVTHVFVNSIGSDEGTGYRRASINIDDISGIGTPSTSAIVKPIISPIYGHGANPVEELGGIYVIVNSRLEFAEGSGDFPVDNDFRRIGLIQDPFQDDTTTVSTDTTLSAMHKMTLSSVSGLSKDDTIMSSSSNGTGVAKSIIVSIDTSNKFVYHLPQENSKGEVVAFATSGTNNVFLGSSSIGTVSAVDSDYPEVQPHSGEIIYIENRGAVSRASDQIEDIKLIVQM